MRALCRLWLLAALPALTGNMWWVAVGEVVTAGGAEGPSFAPRQHTGVLAARGQPAALHCRVLRLGDKAVSWVRSRDLQILAHAGAVFTADARVSTVESGAGSADSGHTLHIQRLRPADSGRYECQVNTDPKLSLFFNLTVLDEPVPAVVVSALTAPDGSLACEARYEPAPRALPLPPLAISWHREGDDRPLQEWRGGVTLEAERWGAARVVSRLTLRAPSAADAGPYRCAAAGHSAALTLTLHETAAGAEAMQRDAAASGAECGGRGGRGAGGALLLAAALLASVASELRPAP